MLNLTQYLNRSVRYCYIIPLIFDKLGKDIPIDAEPAIRLSFNMFILSLIILFCFINIIGYFTSIYLLNKYDIDKKYPKYVKYIKYFEKSRIYIVIIEIILCFLCLIIILLLNATVLGFFILKSF